MNHGTTGVISRENLSAYQRWELASLVPAESAALRRVPNDAADLAAKASQLAELTERARAEGCAAGRAEGMAAAASDVARLARMLETLGAGLRDREQLLADAVLDLALVLGRQLAGEALAVRRDLLMPAIESALAQLPEATQRVRLLLDPSDVELVRSLMEAHPGVEICQLVSDAAIGAGGFRIETEQNQVDATLAHRWMRLAASLGRSYEWLDHS